VDPGRARRGARGGAAPARRRAGGTAAQSAGALQRLDYERLLAQAEQARQAAEGRLAQLQQAQDEDDRARSPRRGKW
jgi:hypothetical protein